MGGVAGDTVPPELRVVLDARDSVVLPHTGHCLVPMGILDLPQLGHISVIATSPPETLHRWRRRRIYLSAGLPPDAITRLHALSLQFLEPLAGPRQMDKDQHRFEG